MWHCHHRHWTPNLPPAIADVANKDLVVGPIYKAVGMSILRRPWDTLTRENILRVDEKNLQSECGIQWAFNGEQTLKTLCAFAHVDVFKFGGP